MKQRLILIFIISFSLLFVKCSKTHLASLNVNGKQASTVPATSLFTRAEKNLVDDYTSTGVGTAPFRVFSQEWTENTYVSEAQYNLAAYNPNAGWWSNLYSIALPNFEGAKDGYSNNIADPATLRNAEIVTDILEIYTYNMLVMSYGPIPYSQALNLTIPFPKYDDEKTVYNDLLMRIDTCIAGIDVTAGSLGDADQIYSGDMNKWKKFAATLKLKMAMTLADTDPSTAAKKTAEAVNTGVFTSNDDNATMAYGSDAVGNSNMLWQALVNSGRHDFVPANYLINTMVTWKDPRLPLYFTTNGAGQYAGGIPGAANGYTSAFSTFSAQMEQATYPGIILDYATTEFLLAEAVARGFSGISGTAQSHYNAGVTASIEYWGGTANDAAAYLSQSAVNYTSAAGTWQQKIGYQQWIANYNMNWDSWTDIRRLGYPNLNVVNPPLGAHGNLPLRFPYPSNESGSNATNWAAAVALLPGGQDVVSAKLFWMK